MQRKTPMNITVFQLLTFSPAAPAAVGRRHFPLPFGKAMCAMALEDRKICAVTAAMEQGTGLTQFAATIPSIFLT